MQLSNRITHLNGGGDDGWGVFNRARQLKIDGAPIVELTQGEHDIGTHPDILAAMNRSATGGNTGYAIVPGSRALRETVAARVEQRTGVPTTYENVMITPGGQSALFSTHSAVCDTGDTALFLEPYYATYPGTLRAVGAIPKAIQTRPEDAFQPRAEDIAAVAPGAKSLLINSPNNPTGTVYSRKTITGIADVCIAHDLWLVSDEVYDTQVWEGAHISPRSLPNMAERTLVVGSMSKSHAMTGSRCGWIVGPEKVIDALTDLATNTTYGVTGFIQDAANYAIHQGPELEEIVAAPFRRRRELAAGILAAQNTVGLIPAQGAMYLMLDIRATGMTGEEFAYALLDAHQIAVMPGESFGASAAGHIRVAMTIDDAAFSAALETVCAFAIERANISA